MAELTTELEAGPVPGSALFRAALAEVGDGVRSVAEADFRLLILRSGLPRPVFNAQLFDADGIFIATVDAWWRRLGCGRDRSRAYPLPHQDRTTNHDHYSPGILPSLPPNVNRPPHLTTPSRSTRASPPAPDPLPRNTN